MKCLFCAKEISDKAKYCSEAHRKAYQRRTKQGAQPGQNDPDTLTRTFDFELTRTDRAFEDSKPNYYTFDDKVYSKTCMISSCDKTFKTRLRFLKFCSPEHMVKALRGIK